MVIWKKTITGAGVTSAETFAGDVLNYVVKYHDDFDLAAGDSQGIARIDTETVFNNLKLKLSDPGENNAVTFSVPEYVEDKTITLPTSLPTTDEWLFKSASQVITGKDINGSANTISLNATSNTITDNSIALGDLFISNGTKFVRRPKGTSMQVYRTNSAGTDTEWATLDNERLGKSSASADGTNKVFAITHGLGSNPTYAFVDCSSHAIARTWVTSSTQITVTFLTAPPAGQTVIIYWRVVA